jgi:hypothetical protein
MTSSSDPGIHFSVAKRVRVDVDPVAIDLLAQANEVRVDGLGRVYGLGAYISR